MAIKWHKLVERTWANSFRHSHKKKLTHFWFISILSELASKAKL